jgi:uncharacterized Zn-binding protein involved in type VI secretion
MVQPPPHVGGPIITGEPTVLIGYMPAARVSDKAVCVPAIDSITKGESTVLIGNQQAARIGDPCAHGGKIVQGCPTVLIGSQSYFCPKAAAAAAAAFFKQG